MPYIEDVLPEDDDATFDPATDVLELIDPSGIQAGGGDSFAIDGADATLVYYFDWKKRRSFIRFMLGFAYADQGSPYRLHRENPQPHPTFPWLVAQTIHFSALSPTKDPELSVPANTPNYPAVFTSNDLNKTSYFQRVYATVRFTSVPYTFRPDAYITTFSDELARNCYWEPTFTTQLISAEGGKSQLQWGQTSPPPPDGNGGPDLTNPAISNLFSTEYQTAIYVLHWIRVPSNYLSAGPHLFFPNKLLSCVTNVNNLPFRGLPAGTVRMQAPTFQRFREPICTFDELDPFYSYNVSVPFMYMNPPLGVPDSDPTNNITPRGHRCLPFSGNGLWFQAKRELPDPDTGGPVYLFRETDLNNFIRHTSDPGG